MKKLIVRLLIMAGVIFAVASLLPNLVEVTGFQAALLAAVALALVNAFIRPIVLILTLPINFLTLGLFTLVVNALMLYLVAFTVDGFLIVGFWQAMAAALLISAVSSFLTKKVVD